VGGLIKSIVNEEEAGKRKWILLNIAKREDYGSRKLVG